MNTATIDRSQCPGTKHGTYSAYNFYGCRCADARAARTRYVKRRQAGIQPPAFVDATPTHRRIRALQAIGYTLKDLGERYGHNCGRRGLGQILARKQVMRGTAKRVAAIYDELHMTPGPSQGARWRAIQFGYVPPLAWEDIDSDPEPVSAPDVVTEGGNRKPYDYDQVRVDRCFAGWMDAKELTTAEKNTVADRLIAQRWTSTQITDRTGLHEQYIVRRRREIAKAQATIVTITAVARFIVSRTVRDELAVAA